MKTNFWQTLQKPFLVQAPLDDVSDVVFREIISRCGRPDVFFTEFTNTDGLASEKGRDKVLHRFLYTENQTPIVAQIWGNTPKHYTLAAKMIKERGFAGIDINMGCPDRKIVKRGECSGLITNHALVKDIVEATQEGAGGLPVSIKTRLGYKDWQTDEWIGFLLTLPLSALTIHGRIASQMSKFPANWEEIGKAVKLRNHINKDIVMIGNGDVLSYQDAVEKHKQYGVDGIMVGRGMFQNPWIFDKDLDPTTIPLKTRLQLLIAHITLFDQTWGKTKDFNIMKKFYKIYVSGFEDASDFRTKLVTYNSASDTIAILKEKLAILT